VPAAQQRGGCQAGNARPDDGDSSMHRQRYHRCSRTARSVTPCSFQS
jgi:hypothetical protein